MLTLLEPSRNPWPWQVGVSALSAVCALLMTHLLWPILQHTPFLFGFAAAILVSALAGRTAGFLAVGFGVLGYIFFPLPLPTRGFAQLLAGFALISCTFSWIVARRYEAEAALRASENRLWLVLSNLPVVIWAINREGSITLAEGRGLEMADLKSSQLLGRSIFELYKDVPEVLENTNRVLRGESFTAIVDIQDAVVEMWYSPIRDKQNCVVGAVAVSLDVTGRARLEQQYLQAQKMESVGQMAAGISHDFNNLLTAIGGYSKMVMTSLDTEDRRREDLLEVCKAADRAGILTKQLLMFSRRQVLSPRVLDVNLLVGQVEKLLRRTISENIDLILDLDSVIEPIRVDPTKLEQVLLNLAVNARDAMPRGGKLRFATQNVPVDQAFVSRFPKMVPGRYVRLTVSDTGTGIAPGIQKRIFEPFFTTKGRGKGTGLGLATVYSIVEQSGGFTSMESSVGKGTTFEIYLPVVAEPIESSDLAEPTDAVLGGSETVLLAEDDGGVRRLAREVLTKWGYTVLEARDGEEAMALAEGHQGMIDLLISDVVMPGIGGRILAARLSDSRPGLRALYTSGYASDVAFREGVRSDMPFLSKPFLPLDLVRMVRAVLDAPDS